jgi:uncharacterized protein (TIGR02099 family)
MSSPAPTSPTQAPRRWLQRCTFWILAPLLGLSGLLLAAWLALHWAILPHIDDWRPELEREASKALGLPLRIGALQASSSGWTPTLDLREVRVIDANGRTALLLPRVSAALSMRSLLTLKLRFSHLLLDSPELLLRRDAQGRVFVAGLSMDGNADTPASDEVRDWFFEQPEFVILHGRVRWLDELRAAPPLELFDLNLLLRNGLRRHELRVDATPPAGWGERFSLRGRFTQSLLKRPGALQHWSGQLYAELPRTDVRELRRYLELPFQLSEGDGALRAWAELDKGQPRSLTLDMGLRSVKLRLAPELPELKLAQIGGRLALSQTRDSLSLEARQLSFRGDDGLDWPRSDWALKLRRDARSGQISGGDFQAQQLDLGLGAQILARLPLTEAQRRLLVQARPGGRLQALQLQWDGPPDAPRSYRAKGQLHELQLAAAVPETGASASARPLRPGIQGAELEFDASEQGGRATLRIDKGQLSLPGLIAPADLPLTQGRAALEWQRLARSDGGTPQWELRLGQLLLVNEELRAELDGRWRSGSRAGDPGRLDLNGRIDELPAARVLRYLPLGIGPDTRRYLRDALQEGQAQRIQLRLAGELSEFPFDAPRSKGQFRVSTQVRDLRLAYVPSHAAEDGQPAYHSPWPAMEQLNAELVFERAGMAIRNGRARLMGVELTGVQGRIADLFHHAPVLEIDGQARGALADMLRFVRGSPVADLTGHALDNTSATGPANLRLNLRLPLLQADQTTLKGQLQLPGNDVRLRPDTPLLGQARARIEFDQKGLQLRAGQARVLGGDASFEGGSQADGSMRFIAQGLATAEALRAAPELGLAAKLAGQMSGQAPLRLEINIPKSHAQTEFSLSSSLQGMALDLPAPLRKSAEDSWPLRLSTRAIPAPAGSLRDELRLELGSQLALAYQRDITAEPKVLRGAIALQDKLPELPNQGVIARANLGSFNADAWQTQAQQWLGGGASHGSEGLDAAMDSGGYMPAQLALQAQSLTASGRTLNRVVAGISRDSANAGWRVSVDAEQLSGFIELRSARPNQPGRVYARLARLALPKSEADSVEQLLDKQPRSVPALDIVVEDFELRGKRLGRLEVEAQQQGDARDWKLSKLQLKSPDATLSATGQWAPEPGRGPRRTELEWRLEVADAGKLLERMGQGQVLRGGKGLLSGQLMWQGSPLSPDYPSMSGKLKVSVDAGQFLKAEPGVARLLGVLSLQSLPRRLILDFRDVFSEGFAFDNFGGDIQIARGVARSDNLRMRGVQAVVLMEGSADLHAETQDLHVLVVPEINAGGAALAYAAVNPAIGLGTFVAQWLLRKPIVAASTEEFRVTGSWADPKVEQLPRRAEPQGSYGQTKGGASP